MFKLFDVNEGRFKYNSRQMYPSPRLTNSFKTFAHLKMTDVLL